MNLRNEKILPPLRPNLGIELAFRRALMRAIEAMHEDVMSKILTALEDGSIRAGSATATHDAGALAQDEPPGVTFIALLIQRIVHNWRARFSAMAGELAGYFANAVHQRSDAALKAILKKGGIAVEWTLSQRVQAILEASIRQNVALIRSIPEQYLGKVEQSVMRSIQAGDDLKQLTNDLVKNFGVERRRAAFIARDQNHKIVAAINRERALEAGAKYAIWMHSGAGKEPRPAHVKAGRDRVRFRIARGWFDPHERKWIQPGQLINCRCSSRIVIEGVAK
jgi:uncharacterized protein with gpF-like domain